MVEVGMGRGDVSLCRSEGGPHEPASCVHGLYNGADEHSCHNKDTK